MARAFFVSVVILTLAVAGGCGDGGGEPEVTSTARATSASTAIATTPPAETPPAAQIPSIEPSAGVTLPAGFAAYPIATGFSAPTSVAPGMDGSIFLSLQNGTVLQLNDPDGDGVFDQREDVATGFGRITGILAQDGDVYVSNTGKVTRISAAGERQDIITGLPNGQHQNNGIAIAPDATLYITNGSTCDDCVEADERSATILHSNLDGTGLRVYARGLRNPYDIAFDSSGQLWATDNGSDAPCATDDELNLIVDGGDYGWPYGNDGCDENTDGTPPVASLGLHTAATGVTPYEASQFPAEYNGDIFATTWGGLFGDPDPLAHKLLHIRGNPRFGRAGATPPAPSATVQVFGSGFANPIDVAVDDDGTLLVLDYGSGTLYRIIYTGA